jgi:hypothetical protein
LRILSRIATPQVTIVVAAITAIIIVSAVLSLANISIGSLRIANLTIFFALRAEGFTERDPHPIGMATTTGGAFVLNIVDLQNTVTSASGLNPVTTLSNTVAQLQEMLIYDEKRLAVNTISKYNEQHGENVNISLTPEADIILEWARKKMSEEVQATALALTNPTVADAYAAVKSAEEQLRIVVELVK